MKVHAVVSQSNGVISVTIQASYVGDMTDSTDKAKIAAFGDPQVNIAGSFTDPSNSSFVVAFPTTEMYVGVTTQLSSNTARFMEALPQVHNVNQPVPIQGPLDCVTTDPSRAAQVWAAALMTAGTGSIAQAIAALRAMMLVPAIPDTTI